MTYEGAIKEILAIRGKTAAETLTEIKEIISSREGDLSTLVVCIRIKHKEKKRKEKEATPKGKKHV